MRKLAGSGLVILLLLVISRNVQAIEVVKEYSLATPPDYIIPSDYVIENDNFEIADAGAYQYLKPIEVPPPIGEGFGATLTWHFQFENDIRSATLFVPYFIDNGNYDPFAILYIQVNDTLSEPPHIKHEYFIGQPNLATEIDITEDIAGGKDVYVRVTTAYLVNGAHVQLLPSYDKLVLRADLVPEVASFGLLLIGVGVASLGSGRTRR